MGPLFLKVPYEEADGVGRISTCAHEAQDLAAAHGLGTQLVYAVQRLPFCFCWFLEPIVVPLSPTSRYFSDRSLNSLVEAFGNPGEHENLTAP